MWGMEKYLPSPVKLTLVSPNSIKMDAILKVQEDCLPLNPLVVGLDGLVVKGGADNPIHDRVLQVCGVQAVPPGMFLLKPKVLTPWRPLPY
jgi:hypothetical protein